MDITAVSFVTLDGLKEFLKKCKETFSLKKDCDERWDSITNYYNETLTEVYIPIGVTQVPSGARTVNAPLYGSTFSGNIYLKSVNLPAVTSLKQSKFFTYIYISGVFAGCINLEKAILPACTETGGYAFYNCTSLANIDLSACTSVETSAFYNCTSLANIDLSACTSVETSAFYNCTSLASIDLPACTSVETSAFYNCTSLASIDLPACTSVGTSTFKGCIALVSVNIPLCTKILATTFSGCTALQTISLPACVSALDTSFENCDNLTEIHFAAANQATIEALAGYASKFGATNATIYFDL